MRTRKEQVLVSTYTRFYLLTRPSDTVMSYKKLHKMGRFAPPSDVPAPAPKMDIPIGARCEVESVEEGLHKRGTVRFVGPTKFAATGVWVGVEYDEPFGRNDGS